MIARMLAAASAAEPLIAAAIAGIGVTAGTGDLGWGVAAFGGLWSLSAAIVGRRA